MAIDVFEEIVISNGSGRKLIDSRCICEFTGSKITVVKAGFTSYGFTIAHYKFKIRNLMFS